MKYDYDIITIGLGPAGMAVSIMASEMGLKVCAVEKNKIGGECMNVGCIPSKALLRIAKIRNSYKKFAKMQLSEVKAPDVLDPFSLIARHLEYISEKKTLKMFDKVDLILNAGGASFIDSHNVEVDGKRISARRIYICTGTSPSVPNIPGLEEGSYLTNETIFSLESVPKSMIVIGGGAIACEMAQAYARLGTDITMVIRGPRLMWREDPEAIDVVEKSLEDDGVTILRNVKPKSFEKGASLIVMTGDGGEKVEAEKVLVAAGRSMKFDSLNLENAGVKYSAKGIEVNRKLQTSKSNIYACGDCNGYAMFSHAAMHQGMLALMNSMMIWPGAFNYKKYVVPWTVFTEPQFSRVGAKESELKDKGIKYEVITAKYEDYGAAVAECVDVGFVKVLASAGGKIYGVTIVGEGSGEMINEWALAIQKKIRLHDIMLLQHSFPTMGFLTKRTSEIWMMKKMGSEMLRKVCRFMFRH